MGTESSAAEATTISEDDVIRQEIEAARAGNAAAGRELLQRVSVGLGNGELHPLLAEYHADCLWNHLRLGVSLERAMHVYRYLEKPTAYDPIELAAVFELLVEFAGMKKGAARGWIKDNIGAGKQIVESAAAAVDIKSLAPPDDKGADRADARAYRRARYLDLLLHTAGSMRRAVSEVLDKV